MSRLPRGDTHRRRHPACRAWYTPVQSAGANRRSWHQSGRPGCALPYPPPDAAIGSRGLSPQDTVRPPTGRGRAEYPHAVRMDWQASLDSSFASRGLSVALISLEGSKIRAADTGIKGTMRSVPFCGLQVALRFSEVELPHALYISDCALAPG